MTWEDTFKDNLLQVLYREDQCRVPAGSPGGGQFASCGPGGFGGDTLGEMGLPSKQDWFNLPQQDADYMTKFLEKDKMQYLGEHSYPFEIQALRIDRKMRVEQRLQERLAGNEDYAYFVQEIEKTGWIDSGGDWNPEGQLVAAWAMSSTENAKAVLMQRLAIEEFGLTDTPTAHFGEVASDLADGVMRDVANPDQFKAGGRAFLREMYNETQAELAAAGITELTVVRGMSVPTEALSGVWQDGMPGPDHLVGMVRTSVSDISLQPMSSFSTSLATANSFTSLSSYMDNYSVVMTMKVPASRVLATPLTGFGCLHEAEVVVLGGVGDAVVSVSNGYISSDNRQFAFDNYFSSL